MARNTIGVARARVPFDSFSAAPLLARLCAPLVLADPKQIPADTAAILDTARNENSAVDLRVFGGNAAVSQTAIDSCLGVQPDAAQGVPVGLPAGTCGGSVDEAPRALLDSSEANDPAWSPDGAQIVFASRSGDSRTEDGDTHTVSITHTS